MSHTETHKIVLVKPAQRQLREKVIDGNVTSILTSTNNKSLAVRGWTLEPGTDTGDSWRRKYAFGKDGDYEYEMYLNLEYERADGRMPEADEMSRILNTISVRASQPAFGRWTLARVDGEDYKADPTVTGNANDFMEYVTVEIPDDFESYFDHLYGLAPHIGRIKTALQAAVMSNFANRFHCALVGPPGCGKSDICRSLKNALGEEAVMEFDATSTTAAGAIKELSEREILPRVVVIEEIEKAPEASMQFLLGILDLRAEIRKTTARATIQRDTKLIAIATVNDYELFIKLQAGALASRFANTIFFKRPSRETLALILTREVSKIRGDRGWIGPALDYCAEHEIDDPRKVIALTLCGRDMLITGEYQTMLAATMPDDGKRVNGH